MGESFTTALTRLAHLQEHHCTEASDLMRINNHAHKCVNSSAGLGHKHCPCHQVKSMYRGLNDCLSTAD